jgi:hypothetical protein
MTRLMIYDNTTLEDGWDGFTEDGLGYSWFAGGRLYRFMRWIDKSKGVGSWSEALDWLIAEGKKKPISMVQYWGHGSWGRVWIGKEALSYKIAEQPSEVHDKWEELQKYLAEDAVIWFRTCQTFGGGSGHHFAKKFSTWMGCKVAAFTYNIGPFQSGLHSIGPGEEPSWSKTEGMELIPGVDGADGRFKPIMGHFGAPNTVFCLKGSVPNGW